MFKPADVEAYIAAFPPETQEKLQQMRAIILKNAPFAEEVLSYRMPAYKQDGAMLVYFAAYKTHIGFYPTPSGIEAFKNDLAPFKYSKGAIQFPLERKLPAQLIGRIVKFRVTENQHKREGGRKEKVNKNSKGK